MKTGFSKWNETDELICSDGNSREHNHCKMTYLDYKVVGFRIDKKVIDVIETETEYWTPILKHIVAVIGFLEEQGLPFRGKNELFGSSNHGNYLGILELISKFDPLIIHVDSFVQKGWGKVSYLSKKNGRNSSI